MLENIQYDPVKQKVVDPVSEDSSILTGYKGNSFLTAGTVYAPYIPITYTSQQHASSNSYGFVIECTEEGVERYVYDPHRDGDINALNDIEEKGLVILDENEEECWIDVIDPKRMEDNIVNGGPKLKATWTFETQEDLEKIYGMTS